MAESANLDQCATITPPVVQEDDVVLLVLPDPERVLANPAAFALPERGDRQLAFLTAVVAAIEAGWANRDAAANLVSAIRVMGVENQYREKLQAHGAGIRRGDHFARAVEVMHFMPPLALGRRDSADVGGDTAGLEHLGSDEDAEEDED